MYKDHGNVPKKLSDKMEMTLVVTLHCIERLMPLRGADENSVVSNLNPRPSDCILYRDGDRRAYMLGF